MYIIFVLFIFTKGLLLRNSVLMDIYLSNVMRITGFFYSCLLRVLVFEALIAWSRYKSMQSFKIHINIIPPLNKISCHISHEYGWPWIHRKSFFLGKHWCLQVNKGLTQKNYCQFCVMLQDRLLTPALAFSTYQHASNLQKMKISMSVEEILIR